MVITLVGLMPYLCCVSWTSPFNVGECTCASEQIALLLSSCLPHVVCNCPVFTVMYIQQIVLYALKNKAVAFVLFCQGYMLVMM